jgi:DNA-binding SARP family transcriptional activator
MDYCEIHNEYEEGISYGMCSLKLDLIRERTHRRMMRLYTLSGDRSSAIRQYEQCALYLKRALNVEPAERTQELYERIYENKPLSSTLALKQAQQAKDKPLVANFDFSHLLSHLTQLTTDLESAHWRIHQDVRAVTEFLRGR